MFGGASTAGRVGDMWAWDGPSGTWSQLMFAAGHPTTGSRSGNSGLGAMAGERVSVAPLSGGPAQNSPPEQPNPTANRPTAPIVTLNIHLAWRRASWPHPYDRRTTRSGSRDPAISAQERRRASKGPLSLLSRGCHDVAVREAPWRRLAAKRRTTNLPERLDIRCKSASCHG